MSEICSNCYEEEAVTPKPNFYYRDYEGNKWDSSIRKICQKCIDAGYYVDEEGRQRLYLGTSRLPKPEPEIWW